MVFIDKKEGVAVYVGDDGDDLSSSDVGGDRPIALYFNSAMWNLEECARLYLTRDAARAIITMLEHSLSGDDEGTANRQRELDDHLAKVRATAEEMIAARDRS